MREPVQVPETVEGVGHVAIVAGQVTGLPGFEIDLQGLLVVIIGDMKISLFVKGVADSFESSPGMVQVSDLSKDQESPFELFSCVGKSTLAIDVVSGQHQANGGSIAVAGCVVEFLSVLERGQRFSG